MGEEGPVSDSALLRLVRWSGGAGRPIGLPECTRPRAAERPRQPNRRRPLCGAHPVGHHPAFSRAVSGAGADRPAGKEGQGRQRLVLPATSRAQPTPAALHGRAVAADGEGGRAVTQTRHRRSLHSGGGRPLRSGDG